MTHSRNSAGELFGPSIATNLHSSIFAAAKVHLRAAIVKAPPLVLPRPRLSLALPRDDVDWEGEKPALLAAFALDPTYREARHNRDLPWWQHPELSRSIDVSDDFEVWPVGPDELSANDSAPIVSLCMIVRNEEHNLSECLKSVADLVDEIIVVDTGSTDRTKDIAREYSAKVFEFAWVDSFAAARNETLRRATGRWVFWLDADDRLDEDNRTKLRNLFSGLKNEMAGYIMKCLCLAAGEGVEMAVDHLRLFRNHPQARWTFRVNEQIMPALRKLKTDVRWSDVVIHHTGFRDAKSRERKLQGDLRLLQLEQAEHPNHPFTLFNLGSIYQELGRTAEALRMYGRSLAGSNPSDSIVRKLYALIAQCHRNLRQNEQALAACREGLKHFAADLELLFQEGVVLRELGDMAGAIRSWEGCLANPKGTHFSSLNPGLNGHITRHNLATVFCEAGRVKDAEAQWRLALTERPGYEPAWRGLVGLWLAQERWQEVEELARSFDGGNGGELASLSIRGRLYLTRKDFVTARKLLESACASFPSEIEFRILLSHVLLQQGEDWHAAESALRDVLSLDCNQSEARHNFLLLLGQGCLPNRNPDIESALAERYRDACTTASDINEHLPTLYMLARECRHVTELGTCTGMSTTAFLFARPEKLVCYDRDHRPQIDLLGQLAGSTVFEFHRRGELENKIEQTDLLFIHAGHEKEQLANELRRNCPRVQKYIVLHGSNVFGERGATDGHAGLWKVIEEFVSQGLFRLKARYSNQNGLTVLESLGPTTAV